MAEKKRGTCGKCKKAVVYRDNYWGACWVHEQTGSWMSNDPEKHDANTYVVPELVQV